MGGGGTRPARGESVHTARVLQTQPPPCAPHRPLSPRPPYPRPPRRVSPGDSALHARRCFDDTIFRCPDCWSIFPIRFGWAAGAGGGGGDKAGDIPLHAAAL